MIVKCLNNECSNNLSEIQIKRHCKFCSKSCASKNTVLYLKGKTLDQIFSGDKRDKIRQKHRLAQLKRYETQGCIVTREARDKIKLNGTQILVLKANNIL